MQGAREKIEHLIAKMELYQTLAQKKIHTNDALDRTKLEMQLLKQAALRDIINAKKAINARERQA